jgi:menaquinone-dependent protoporphyrinogen oxidase
MKVLVASASKHGATGEIGDAIGAILSARGHIVTTLAAEQVEAVHPFDAAVIGSAVYAGHWMKQAIDLAERFTDRWADRAVWLFSSGPIGEPPKPEEDPVDVSRIMQLTGARAHRIFTGRLDKSKLSFPERAMVSAFRAPYGDFRNWDNIRTWASEIAEELVGADSAAATGAKRVE